MLVVASKKLASWTSTARFVDEVELIRSLPLRGHGDGEIATATAIGKQEEVNFLAPPAKSAIMHCHWIDRDHDWLAQPHPFFQL